MVATRNKYIIIIIINKKIIKDWEDIPLEESLI